MLSQFRKWRRRRTARGFAVEEAQWQRVEARLPFLDYLPQEDRPRLRQLALEFLADKEMTGARGFELTDDIRLGVALQACLPVLNLGLEAYGDFVGIVIYPGEFVVPRKQMDEAGVMHEFDDFVLGEAWEGGPVILAWLEEDYEDLGANVVIHEFAHKLDMLNGGIDGLPRLPAGMSRSAWAEAFAAAFKDFCRRVDRGQDMPIDPYAAENPSEFFAVMSEAFFEAPLLLREEYPEVYRQLSLYYRLDPAAGAAEPG